MKSFNIRPYFDDFDENKQFYQILFRPSYAIQARELNQLQSILQQQIARHGQNIFKEGSMVVPGQLSIDTTLDYVQLDGTYSGASVDTYIDSFYDESIELIGLTSGVKAKVVHYEKSTDENPPTLWVKYISSGDATETGTVKTFQPGEIFYSSAASPVYASVRNSSDAIGVGSSANIQQGVYFVNGRFVLAKTQTIVLDPYTNSPSYRIGLQVEEDFVSPEEDSTLYDNAQGSTNYAAPGAHRYFIDLILTKYEINDTTDKSFIELLRVVDGRIESKVSRTEYSILEDSMARRTFDESGNYVVKDFAYQVREHRSNDRGTWTANTKYLLGDIVSYNGTIYKVETTGNSGLTPPSHTIGSATNGGTVLVAEKSPAYNNGVYSADTVGDANSMSLQVEPGKAYVYGYEIEKVGTSSVKIEKPTTFKGSRNATIRTNVGSYVVVENVYGFVDVTKFPTVSLRGGFTVAGGTAAGGEVGTAKIRYIEYDSGTIGTASCKYIVSLFDINMNEGKTFDSNVHQIYFDNATGVDFTCDLSKNLEVLTGTLATTNGSTAVTGNGTKFTTELNVGDALFHYDVGVLQAPLYVATISSDTSLTLTGNAGHGDTNAQYYVSRKKLKDGSNDSLVYELPTKYTRKVKDVDDEGTTNISYYIRQTYTGVVSSGSLTISTASSAETYASPQQPDAFHVVSTGNGAVIPATISLNGSANVATITVGAGYNGVTVAVLATTKKTLKERTKTITRGYSEDFTTSAIATAKTVSLGKVDGIRLLKVSEFTDAGGTPIAFGGSIPGNAIEVDITNRYSFDTGCKDSFYDFASITNLTSVKPRSPIRVVYDYHEHSTVGDYFTVDSYQKTIKENYTIKGQNKTVDLYDCIDFRPTKTSTGFSASGIPAIGFDVIADYTYYLPRIDKISLSSTGEFVVTSGVPAEYPSEPQSPENSMLLYTSTIYPSIVDTPVVQVKREDNKRYTMKDIGKLEDRLSNVEYYTSLSLLESQTNNLQLTDSTGNVAFKNGFIVDSLTDQRIGDTDSSEYRCSIDVAEGKLRPAFARSNVKLIEKASSDADRLSSGYRLQNGIATLPYTTKTFASQPFASTTESVTPYIKLNFIGDVGLTPSSDEWYETSYRPDIVISQEGNFNAVANQYKAELGTVWNEWQTVWSGRTTRTMNFMTSATDFRNRFTTTQEVGQVRSGTTTYVKPVYSTTVIDDRVVSVDIIPFIRSRVISFYASGLKPNTLMYPYFDNSIVSAFVSAAAKITLTSKSGVFDTTTNAGSESDKDARTILNWNNAVSTGLSVGDVIHNGTAGNINLATATAIVKIDEDDGVRVVNIRGTFTPGQTVYGSISGATGVIYSVETNSKLVTNIYGEVAGTFTIPSFPWMRFRTGKRIFTLTDSYTNSENYTTKASAPYIATGYMENRERTVVSTRNGVLAQEVVNETRTTNVVAQTTYVDPLAQSFKTPADISGLFVDSVDVFFAGKDRTLPVYFEIREMANGFPTTKVIPGSRVSLKPSQITTSENGSVATRIKTQYPIYLDGDTEYCFVMMSDSPYYRVWVSQLGQDDIITGQRIVKQPYLGSLFKSQNASTWTPEQLQDIKFNINRCVFSVNSANIRFSNQKLDSVSLESTSIYTKSGSNLIRVKIPNNGIPVGSSVTISGLTTSVNGISAASINGTRTVLQAGLDHVVVTAGGNATITGFSNFSETVYATKNFRFDVIHLLSSQIKFPGTSIQHFARAINTSYSMANDAVEVMANENTELQETWMVASYGNEVSFNNSAKSMEVIAQLQTTTDYLSPVIDMDRYSLVLVGNRIDMNSTDKNYAGLDDSSSSLSLTFSATNKTITSGTTGAFITLKSGNIVSISGAANSANNGIATVTGIDPTGTILTVSKALVAETATCTIIQYFRFADEISENGTSCAKYPMKTLNLSAPATDIRIFMDVNMFSPASIDVYYRIASNGNKTTGANWTLIQPINPIGYASSADVFLPAEYQINNQVPFNTAQLKIVMKSSDTTKVPVIRQIRMIATS